MEMDGRSSSVRAGIETDSVPLRQGRSKIIYQFTQQNLPACKPVLSPPWVISTFFVVGVIFFPIGLLSLHASQNIPKHMKAPIYIYYQLDNYYQNHRRYVKSRSDQQLLHGLKHHDISSCAPEDFKHGLPVVPCGLIAWSLFNDTYSFFRGIDEVKVNRKNIAWKSDRDHKFGKQVYPFNFQNGTLSGGAHLDPNIPLSDQEDLIVWMRTSALPTFRKLYGRIEEDLDADDIITVKLLNNYNTYSFSGSKKLVLSTSSWLGGHNNFLGMAYISIGASFIFVAFVFMLIHVKNPRPNGDTTNLSCNWKPMSG
ncbi:putative ALA-interacting subunit 2 isoform X2 [Sesamum indicum]|uniref:ALA-interacting subunit n=1 Tax=Sesamum indicum TaxID=4182 RepID=A0A8M8UYN4_SESIN|nr:putative ALA-interacting subunit 2 isoform X2 [Sesamum indicum]